MTHKIERSLVELYADDPERADAVVLGRDTGPSRRGFLEGAGLAAFGAIRWRDAVDALRQTVPSDLRGQGARGNGRRETEDTAGS